MQTYQTATPWPIKTLFIVSVAGFSFLCYIVSETGLYNWPAIVLALLAFLAIACFYKRYQNLKAQPAADPAAQLKLPPIWRVALVYYLTIFVAYWMPKFVSDQVISYTINDLWLSHAVLFVLNIFTIYLAVHFSATLLNLRYRMNDEDKKKVIRLSLVYFFIVNLVFYVIFIRPVIDLVYIAEMAVLLYIFGKRLIAPRTESEQS